jgi:hypothetical protein
VKFLLKKAFSKKIKGKKFSLLGEGFEARAWKIEGMPNSRKKGSVIRVLKAVHRTPERLKRLRTRFIAMQIAHELFPRNVPKATEINVKKGRTRLEFVALREEEWFKSKHVKSIINFLRKLSNAGFEYDSAPGNISTRKPQQPVIYEILGVNVSKLRKWLARQKISKRKRNKIEGLIQEYEKAMGEKS